MGEYGDFMGTFNKFLPLWWEKCGDLDSDSAIRRPCFVLFFCGGKERLIQLLDYSSVVSPQSGLFSDWSRNKGYLELSRD